MNQIQDETKLTAPASRAIEIMSCFAITCGVNSTSMQ